MQSVVYYIGGPEDLSKKVMPKRPGSTLFVGEFKPLKISENYLSEGPQYVDVVEHRYIVRQIGRDTYIAQHESTL